MGRKPKKEKLLIKTPLETPLEVSEKEAPKKVSRIKVALRILHLCFSVKLWKTVMFGAFFFAMTVLILEDLLVMAVRAFIPGFLSDSQIVILDKLLDSIENLVGVF